MGVWAYLTQSKKALRELGGLEELAKISARFDTEFGARRLSVEDYPAFVERSLPAVQRMNRELGLRAEELLDRIAASLGNSARTQQAHRDFLLRLEALP